MAHARSILAAAAALVVLPSVAPAQPEYTVTEVPRPPNTLILFPLAMNNHAEVVGWVMLNEPGGLTYPWRWSAASGTVVMPSPAGNGQRNRAADINDAGVIVGDGYDNSGGPWVYQNGQYSIILPASGETKGHGNAINSSGVAVGAFAAGTGNRSFIKAPGAAAAGIDPLTDNQAISINDSSVVAGAIGATAGFVWDEAGGMTMIPGLNETWTRMGVAKINSAGLVLGNSAPYFGGNTSVPYLYTRHGTPLPLQQIAARTRGLGLNDLGHAVGEGHDSTGYRGWVYTPERGMRLLTPLIDPGLGWTIETAIDINNAGQIVAHARRAGTTYSHVLLLTPARACYANCDSSQSPPVLNVADFSCFLQKYAAGDAYANCDESAEPPVLNVADFSCFLQRYAAGCP
ncbi:MAG: GC-type dockerin domain-anchored protein [Phycisphaerales bacterium]